MIPKIIFIPFVFVALLVLIPFSAETFSAEKKEPNAPFITRSPNEGIVPTETDRTHARELFSEAQKFSKEKNDEKAFLSALRCLDEINRWKPSTCSEEDQRMAEDAISLMRQMSNNLKKSYISDLKANLIRY